MCDSLRFLHTRAAQPAFLLRAHPRLSAVGSSDLGDTAHHGDLGESARFARLPSPVHPKVKRT
jgi:hypothetical protein